MDLELTVLNSLKIYQPRNGYRFSSEPFALTKEIDIKNNSVIADFGSGCGIISILLAHRCGNCNIIAVESSYFMREIIKKNLELNQICNVIIVKDLNEIHENSVDSVVSNPPYFVDDSYRKSEKFFNEKFETINIDDTLKKLRRIIKNKGLVRMSYHPARFLEVIGKLNDYGFGIKSITPVYGNKKRNASYIIIDSKSAAKNHPIFRKPIYLEDL